MTLIELLEYFAREMKQANDLANSTGEDIVRARREAKLFLASAGVHPAVIKAIDNCIKDDGSYIRG